MNNPKLNTLLESAKATEWLLRQGRQEHSAACNHSDPDSYGPCTCGYLEDKKYRIYFVEIVLGKLIQT